MRTASYNPPVKPTPLTLVVAAALGAAAFAAQQSPPRPFDLLITNARIIDGTGGPSTTGAVAVRDGKIAAINPTIIGAGNVRAGDVAIRTIDAGGKVVAPDSSIRIRIPTSRC